MPACGGAYASRLVSDAGGGSRDQIKCESLGDLERFSRSHHCDVTEALGLDLRHPPSDSALFCFLLQVDVAALYADIRDWTIAQIPFGAVDLEQLVCGGKTIRGSVESTSNVTSEFIA